MKRGKRLKEIFALALAVGLAWLSFTGSFGQGGKAEASEVSPVVSVKSATYYIGESTGDEVRMDVYLEGNEGFNNLSIEIDYDSSKLSLKAVENIKGMGMTIRSQSLSVRPYLIGWTSDSVLTYNGRLATLVFDISEASEDEICDVSVSYFKGRNNSYKDGENVNFIGSGKDNESINLSYKSGKIRIRKPETLWVASYNGDGRMADIRCVDWDYVDKQMTETDVLYIFEKDTYVPKDNRT